MWFEIGRVDVSRGDISGVELCSTPDFSLGTGMPGKNIKVYSIPAVLSFNQDQPNEAQLMRKLNSFSGQTDSDVDITPLLDVVFIMLIFFIVTASFVKEQGIGIYNPPNSEPKRIQEQPIVVVITDLDEILIENRRIDVRSVRPTIVRLKAESPNAAVVVYADSKARTKFIVQAVDGIRAANVRLPSISLKSG